MTAHAYGCAVKNNNKPKAEQETAQPTAARFNKRNLIEELKRRSLVKKFKKN